VSVRAGGDYSQGWPPSVSRRAVCAAPAAGLTARSGIACRQRGVASKSEHTRRGGHGPRPEESGAHRSASEFENTGSRPRLCTAPQLSEIIGRPFSTGRWDGTCVKPPGTPSPEMKQSRNRMGPSRRGTRAVAREAAETSAVGRRRYGWRPSNHIHTSFAFPTGIPAARPGSGRISAVSVSRVNDPRCPATTPSTPT